MISFIILLINYFYNFTKIMKNNHKDYNFIGWHIYKLYERLLNFKQYISFYDIDEYHKIEYNPTNRSSRILLISNCVNMLDSINIQKFISEYYAEYMPVYVMPETVKKIPIYGNLMSEHFILLKNNIKYDKKTISQKCQKLYNDSITSDKKYIIIVFPEGCVRTVRNIELNKKWCNANNINPLFNLINPRISGLNLITKNFKQEKTLLSTLIYSDDLNNTKSKTIYDIIFTNIAKCCHIYICDISQYFTYGMYLSNILENSIFYIIWVKQNSFINFIYKYDIYRNHINKSNKIMIVYVFLFQMILFYILTFKI